MKEEYALGKNGEIKEIISKEEFIRRFPNEHLEIDPYDYCPPRRINLRKDISKEQAMVSIKEYIAETYKNWGKFGPNGDVISIAHPDPFMDENRIILFVARRAFPSPKLAVDCVIFVRDEAGNYFFVGIERSKEPGKGKAALVGGFIDVDGYDMETTLQATLREVLEEVGLEMIAPEEAAGDFISDDIPLFVVIPNSNGAIAQTNIHYVGDTETGDEEKLGHLGTKRVHRTFVYTCLLNFPGILTADTVREYFKAGSDAAKLAIIPFSPADPKSVQAAAKKLAISHHKKMFLKALAVIMQ